MILEVAVLNIKPGQEADFELAFGEAQTIIAARQGYISHQLKKCIEKPNRYILLVSWSSLQDHTEGFRKSVEYEEWRRLLHHFYEPFPEVEHYTGINGVN
jgi:heme-degrading monooxygenase HmoA